MTFDKFVNYKHKRQGFDVRKKFFDEHLNYTKQFGMLSSEFIFTRIADELKEATI